MSVGSKHIATFLLGAAAALAAQKYMSMTPEEKEKLASKLKEKAHQFKDEAENAADKAKDYFNEFEFFVSYSIESKERKKTIISRCNTILFKQNKTII